MEIVGRVSQLARYPVKSMQGEDLATSEVGPMGFEGDRTFAVWDRETGKVASAKRPRLWRALLDCSSFIEAGEVQVRLPDGETVSVSDQRAAERLSALLGRSVELRPAQAGMLGSYESDWPRIEGVTIEGERDFQVALGSRAVRYVDVAALHLMTTATLHRLGTLTPDSNLDPRRFRPNLLIDTGDVPASFLEDGWVGRRLRIGADAEFEVTMPAPRCVMTTVEQPGLEEDPGVLRAAAQNRHQFRGGTMAVAGIYAEVVAPGSVRLGDEVALV